MKRVRVSVFGRVQGVGFRYFAQECASMCEITGWVKNEWDGSVTLEIQGDEEEITRFLAIVRLGTRYAHVDRLTKEEVPVLETERGFHIRW